MTDVARLNSLLERAADATAPERSLFAEVSFACAGRQHPDIKAHFAMRMEAQALSWDFCVFQYVLHLERVFGYVSLIYDGEPFASLPTGMIPSSN